MTKPIDIIYDLVIEKLRGIVPVCVFIQFDENHDWSVKSAKSALNGMNISLHGGDIGRIEAAIEMLKWAAANDPQPPAPDMLEFLESI